MKRHEGLIPLSREHQKGLLLAQLLKKTAPDYRGLPDNVPDKITYTQTTYEKELVPHFQKEEEILIPVAKKYKERTEEMTRRILEEHHEIKQMIQNLEKGGDLIEKMDTLGHFLEKHIRYEEREVFPALERILSEEDLQEVLDALNSFHS